MSFLASGDKRKCPVKSSEHQALQRNDNLIYAQGSLLVNWQKCNKWQPFVGEVDCKAIAQEGRIPEMVPEHITVQSETMHERGKPESDKGRAAIAVRAGAEEEM